MELLNNVMKQVDERGRGAFLELGKIQSSPLGTEAPSGKKMASLVRRVMALPPDLQEKFFDSAVARVGPDKVLETFGGR